jgi:hypothetical protein
VKDSGVKPLVSRIGASVWKEFNLVLVKLLERYTRQESGSKGVWGSQVAEGTSIALDPRFFWTPGLLRCRIPGVEPPVGTPGKEGSGGKLLMPWFRAAAQKGFNHYSGKPLERYARQESGSKGVRGSQVAEGTSIALDPRFFWTPGLLRCRIPGVEPPVGTPGVEGSGCKLWILMAWRDLGSKLSLTHALETTVAWIMDGW